MPRAAELSRATEPALDVIVGIVCDPASRVLIGQRPGGKHMEGFWEFPGGKLMAGETPLAGLRRELFEELGIEVGGAEPLMRYTHRYPERTVRLDVWWILDYEGEAEPREAQHLRWVDVEALADAPLLPADAPIVAAIRERLLRITPGARSSAASAP
jgi:8-oxo-dGTP diphosphatase